MAYIENAMLRYLNNEQFQHLHKVLSKLLTEETLQEFSNDKLISMFCISKRVEGCSDKTIHYYKTSITNVLKTIGKSYNQIDTNDIRTFLNNYQLNNSITMVTVDNVRRILSSFFNWLEEEEIITKSPLKRIHKIKTSKKVKETYSDENLEKIRENCLTIRDKAIIDLLCSTGMRVGELVRLNINDIDFVNRECIVLGKGNKQRLVYFDARTKLHLEDYINRRDDKNPALFVTLLKPHRRLKISGVEIRLRQLGRRIGISRVHPHKFRRTLATMAIDKGMPIEQVQHMLGHNSIDTTLEYAMINQNNVKISHHKFIC